MKGNKKGLRLCRKGRPGQSSGDQANVDQFPGLANRETDASRAERPPIDRPTAIFIAIVCLLFGMYLGIGLKDLAEGKPPLNLDIGGAPEPCAPPSQGIWPDCHVPAQK